MEIDGKRAALNEVVAIERRNRHVTSILLMPDIMQSRSREKPLKEKQGYFILILILFCVKDITAMNLNIYFEIYKDKTLLEI